VARKPRSKNPERRKCSAITRSGSPCKNWAITERDTCHFHGPDHAAAVAKGGKATAEKAKAFRAQLDEAKAICDLLSPAQQAEYMNFKIMQQEFGENDWKAINAFMAHLIKLTQESDPTQTIIIERKITPPDDNRSS
jgi:hypothetical protein